MIPPRTRFATRVRSEMDAQGLSVRALARRIDPANLDRARRNLHRWLDEGMQPTRTSRVAVARALGVDVSELEEDDDDEEGDIQAVLTAWVTTIVRAEILRVAAAAEGGSAG